MPKLQKGKAAVLTQQQFSNFLSLVGDWKHGKRNTLAVLLSFGTGMRVKEIAALKVSDVIDMNDEIIEEVSLSITKNKKQRNIYLIDKRLKSALTSYIEERKQGAVSYGEIYSRDQPLILSQKGLGFTNITLQMLFQNLYRKAQIHGASSHSGRRTFATNLIEQGADIKSVSVLMGHSSIAMTAEYVQENPLLLKRLASIALYKK